MGSSVLPHCLRNVVPSGASTVRYKIQPGYLVFDSLEIFRMTPCGDAHSSAISVWVEEP